MCNIFNNLDTLLKMGIHLRPSMTQDKDFVLNLSKETMKGFVQDTWEDTCAQEEYFDKLAFHEENTYIIYDEKQLLGRISLLVRDEDIFIDGIHLAEQGRGKGIGTYLLSTVITEAKKENKSISLKVLKNNPANKLYSKLGFKIEEETLERYTMKCA